MDLIETKEGTKMSQEELVRLFHNKPDSKLLKILKIKKFMSLRPAWNLRG